MLFAWFKDKGAKDFVSQLLIEAQQYQWTSLKKTEVAIANQTIKWVWNVSVFAKSRDVHGRPCVLSGGRTSKGRDAS